MQDRQGWTPLKILINFRFPCLRKVRGPDFDGKEFEELLVPGLELLVAHGAGLYGKPTDHKTSTKQSGKSSYCPGSDLDALGHAIVNAEATAVTWLVSQGIEFTKTSRTKLLKHFGGDYWYASLLLIKAQRAYQAGMAPRCQQIKCELEIALQRSDLFDTVCEHGVAELISDYALGTTKQIAARLRL